MKQKVNVIISGRDSFVGEVTNESTTHFRVYLKDKNATIDEWFAKESKMVNCLPAN